RTAELSATLEKLQEDEEAGRKIQTRLLPLPVTNLCEYQFSSILMPSMYLSGDFLDYFQLDRNHICFYVADVSRHGASSAFVTVFLKSFMSQIIKNYKDDDDKTIFDPAKILHLLNQQLLKEDLEKHLTLFYGIINVRRNSILFCNGGQYPFPILLNGKSTYFIDKKGTPVGLFDFTKFENNEFTLPESFNLFIASDGVIDILPQKDLKGKEKYLLDSINDISCSLKDIVDKLGLKNKDNLPDDVTLMMIKRRK
ncbi:MAG: serine/threonine-protein phosphatase, partial [Calditrichia bacterium]|nr:serine/threonine-protein phosphatase [Calditrichia bacterium]